MITWECEHCGCQGITQSVEFCPMCFAPKDVAAEPGQPADDSQSTDGSSDPPVPESSPKVLRDASVAASSSPKSSKSGSDWGKS